MFWKNLILQEQPIAIVQDGKVIHSKGYGVTSVKTKDKVNENTRFAIASNSKAFTSAALAILVDEGKLKWSDKVVDHLAGFKMYDTYVTANFTIVDLLTHRSGLGLGAGDLMFFPDGGDFRMEDILQSFQYQKKVSDFRTQFDYDNLLYVVAGEIIEQVSGMSWSEFVEKKIMKPIGMNNSAGIYSRLSDKENVAMPHSTVDGKLNKLEHFEIDLGAAAGGIYASLNDLTKWMLLHMNKGDHNGTTIFSKENHAEMWRPHTNMGFNPTPTNHYKSHFNAYGLGWGISDMNGYVVFSHIGGLPGMLSKTTIIPELNLGIVILTNTEPGGGAGFSAMTNTLLDKYLGLEDFGWVEKYAARLQGRQESGDEVVDKVWKKVAAANDDQIKPKNFVGMYKDNWF
jgi:CubicO group peptidase (beta-lactamase class C family)